MSRKCANSDSELFSHNNQHASKARHLPRHAMPSKQRGLVTSNRIAQAAVVASLAGIITCGAGGITPGISWANNYNFPDGSFNYANQDTAAKVSDYITVSATPCDVNKNFDKAGADTASFGTYYHVTYTFTNKDSRWGDGASWWCSIPSNVQIVQENNLQQEDTTFSTSHTTIAKTSAEFAGRWKTITGETKESTYQQNTQQLVTVPTNTTSISVYIKVSDKQQPLYFAAGVYQEANNTHYSSGKVEAPITLPALSEQHPLALPDDAVDVTTLENISEPDRAAIVDALWEKNKNNDKLLAALSGMPTSGDDNAKKVAFKAALKFNETAGEYDGSVVVSYRDGSTDTIAKEILVKQKVAMNKRIVLTYPQLIDVNDPDALTTDDATGPNGKSDQTRIKEAFDTANSTNSDYKTEQNSNVKSITVDNSAHTIVVTFVDNSQTTIEAKYVVKKKRTLAEQFTPFYPARIRVSNYGNPTSTDKDNLKQAIYDANKEKTEFCNAIGDDEASIKQHIVINADNSATITYRDGSTDIMAARDLVAQLADLRKNRLTIPKRVYVNFRQNDALYVTDLKKLLKSLKNENQFISDIDRNRSFYQGDRSRTFGVVFKDNSIQYISYDELAYTEDPNPKGSLKADSPYNYTFNFTKFTVDPKKESVSEQDWNKIFEQFIKGSFRSQYPSSKTYHIRSEQGKSVTGYDVTPDAYYLQSAAVQYFKGQDPNATTDKTRIVVMTDDLGRRMVTGIYLKNAGKNVIQAFLPICIFKDTDVFTTGITFDASTKKEHFKQTLSNLFKYRGLQDLSSDFLKKDTNQSDFDNMKSYSDYNKLVEKAITFVKQAYKSTTNEEDFAAAKNRALQSKQETSNSTYNTSIDEAKRAALQHQNDSNNSVTTLKQKWEAAKQARSAAIEAAKTKASLQSAKQTIISKVYAHAQLTPNQKLTFVKSVMQAGNQQALDSYTKQNNAIDTAASQNQSASDSQNKTSATGDITSLKDKGNLTEQQAESYNQRITNNENVNTVLADAFSQAQQNLQTERATAKQTIGALEHLGDQKQGFIDRIDPAQTVQAVKQVVDEAKLADKKAEAKQKIAKLKENGDITDEQEKDLNKRIDEAQNEGDVAGVTSDAEGLKTKKEEDKRQEQAKLEAAKKQLNEAITQAKALKKKEAYTSASAETKQKFDTALDEAIQVAQQADASIDTIQQAHTKLTNILKTLSVSKTIAESVKLLLKSAIKPVMVYNTSALTEEDAKLIAQEVYNANKHLGISTQQIIVNVHIPEVIITFGDGSACGLDVKRFARIMTQANTTIQLPKNKLRVQAEKLTPQEKEALVKAFLEANKTLKLPESSIFVTYRGSIYVSFNDNSREYIEAEKLVELAHHASAPSNVVSDKPAIEASASTTKPTPASAQEPAQAPSAATHNQNVRVITPPANERAEAPAASSDAVKTEKQISAPAPLGVTPNDKSSNHARRSARHGASVSGANAMPVASSTTAVSVPTASAANDTAATTNSAEKSDTNKSTASKQAPVQNKKAQETSNREQTQAPQGVNGVLVAVLGGIAAVVVCVGAVLGIRRRTSAQKDSSDKPKK